MRVTDENLKEIMSQRIRILLAKENKKQVWLSKQIGTDSNRIIKCNILPSLVTTIKIANAFDVPVDYIIGKLPIDYCFKEREDNV